MKNRITLFAVIVLSTLLFATFSSASESNKPFKLRELMAGMAELEKKEVVLEATVAGSCNSGCKIWVSDGPYKKGDPVALVWAKDKAFTFKTDAAGQQVLLEGFAVGEYIDLCETEREEAKQEHEDKDKSDCNPIIVTETGKKQLDAISFFATSVSYK